VEIRELGGGDKFYVVMQRSNLRKGLSDGFVQVVYLMHLSDGFI
jgi:hypothetical protein